MSNRIIDIITRKEKKKYDHIIQLIKDKRYENIFELDSDGMFGLSNPKYVDRLLVEIENEITANIDFLVQMHEYGYRRFNYFSRNILSKNPNVIEYFITNNIGLIDNLIIMALDNGYNPSDDFIESHINYFSYSSILMRIIHNGYKPSNEMIEKIPITDENILLRAFEWGYVPSLDFIKKYNLLNNKLLISKILDVTQITPDFINSNIFYGNALAQQEVIERNPEALEKLSPSSSSYYQFWMEAFKLGYIPEYITRSYTITNNFTLFSKMIKQEPSLIRNCSLYDKEQKNQIDELALSMGYVPTISDALNYEYVRRSNKLMKTLISIRPEAIKYVEYRTDKNIYMQQNEFFDLVRLALDSGYIPTLNDLEYNKGLIDSFDIMKILIQDNPELINSLSEDTPKKEELLKLSIKSGFNGELTLKENNADSKLLYTETAIIYQIDSGKHIQFNDNYENNYSIDLYNYLISKGYKVEDIINLFNNNFEVMKEIISNNPKFITSVSTNLSRKEIDELSLLAINGGYEPKFEDDIFGYGSAIAKLMVKKYPAYLEKVKLFDNLGFFISNPCEEYDEICRISIETGYLPDINKMGDGYGGATTIIYNKSYDIMKKAIPLNPSLIESCSVEDKEKYDELCRLALSYGYDIPDEYTLTHYGAKMCSNYDIMARYIAKNPYFILNADISNQNEMIKLIDLALSSGLNITKLSQKQLIQLFVSIDENLLSKYLSDTQILDIKKAKELHGNNDEVTKTLNPKFISSSIAKNLNEFQFEILSCYPKLQEKLANLSLGSIEYEIILSVITKYENNLEWVPILERALDNLEALEYSNLFADLKNKKLTDLDRENIVYLIITNNHLDISCLDELRDIQNIKNNYINDLIKRNTIGSLKTAYLEKVFGIDLENAINLVKTYGSSLNSKTLSTLDSNSRNTFIILENIKRIINLNNIDILKYYIDNVNPEIIISPDLMVSYEAKLKYLFTEEFNKSITKPNELDRYTSSLSDEQDLDIYLAAGAQGNKKCRMMITSIGAYTGMPEPDDYYSSWNIGKIASHGCCCSYVGEKNLGTAEVKYCCLGFSDYELGALHLSAPYDLCSSSAEDKYQIAAEYPSMFLLPDDVLAHTRHTHNETVWERRNISKNNSFKKQPSYIVYFVDNFEDRLTNPEAKKQWESVKKAASNFTITVDGVEKSLPIMVVEREKIARHQRSIIQSKLEEFKQTLNKDLIEDIVTDYESNYAGNREYHMNIVEKYFPHHDKLSDSIVGEIITTIESIYKDNPSVAIECLESLEKVVKEEQKKYNNTQQSFEPSMPSFNIEDALISINILKSNFTISNDSTLNVIPNCEENNRQYEKSDNTSSDQLTSSDVIDILESNDLTNTYVMYENQIKEEKINSRLKVYGQRHIKDVLLYTTIIGKSTLDNKHDLELSMLAAMYHKSGKKIDGYENYTSESCNVVSDKLKDNYSELDLAIITTAIQFHIMPRELSNIDDVFVTLALKNGIPKEEITRARKIAEVLKDADALDRTRFINSARLNPELLQFEISKKLVKFSASIQERYATEDLKQYNCDESISILLEKYTPQEILRTIRKSTRGNTNSEDAKSFIDSWAYTMLNKSDNMEESIKYGK